MKKIAFQFILKCAALVMLCGHSALAQAGTETNAPAYKAAPALVRSVFVDDPRMGKDPFFPNSTRRQPTVDKTTNAPAPSSDLFKYLSLKGISGLKGQRLALINSSTVSVGEYAEIRCGQHGLQSVKILCRDIRDDSVFVELVGIGEVRELKLRDGI